MRTRAWWNVEAWKNGYITFITALDQAKPKAIGQTGPDVLTISNFGLDLTIFPLEGFRAGPPKYSFFEGPR
jgi:hypothetical protein